MILYNEINKGYICITLFSDLQRSKRFSENETVLALHFQIGILGCFWEPTPSELATKFNIRGPFRKF